MSMCLLPTSVLSWEIFYVNQICIMKQGMGSSLYDEKDYRRGEYRMRWMQDDGKVGDDYCLCIITSGVKPFSTNKWEQAR